MTELKNQAAENVEEKNVEQKNAEMKMEEMNTEKPEKRLGPEELREIRIWMHRNARPLDLAVWKYHFEGGSAEAIAEELRFYQNPDGGFAHAVEPDLWNPCSTPYATLTAATILERIGVSQSTEVLEGIFRYFESGDGAGEDGWHFSVPSNDNYPHAPWWSYSEEANRVQDMGLTAGICAFIILHGKGDEPVFHRACGYAEEIFGKVGDAADPGEMGIGSVLRLADAVRRRGMQELTEMAEAIGLDEKIGTAVNRSIEREPEKWKYYTVRPSAYIASPDSPFYKENEKIVEAELDYLIDTRAPGGVWDITWNWGFPEKGDIYPKEFAVSENWWKAQKAVENLLFLRNFGRVYFEERTSKE